MAVNTPASAGTDTKNQGFQKFQVRPQLLEYGKMVTMGARTDLISCSIQVIANGGETNMHAHKGNDAIWLVLNGKARFYGLGDEVVAELDKYEALVIPRDVPYWFESANDENLVILRFGAKAQNEEQGRTDYGERQFIVPGAEGGVEREVKFLEGKFFGDE